MKDEIISFETAKSAKNKGFNIPQLSWYNFSGLFVKGDYIREYQSANGKFPTYTAPTQSLLQRWLREKHGIHICMIVSNSGSYFASIYSLYTEQFLMMHISSTKDETYESVLETALQEGLKLITSKT